MTLENRILVGLADIAAVILECGDKKCHARVSASPDKIRIPKNCPQCNGTWWTGDAISQQYDNPRQMTFLESLAKLRDREADGATFKILLEFEARDGTALPSARASGSTA